MKKYIYSLLAFSLCLVACKPKEEIGNIDKSSIVGRWKIISQDEQPVLTDSRIVFTFNADGSGTQTMAADLHNIGEQAWYVEQRLKYTLNGDALHTQWTNSTILFEWLASITNMTDNQFIADPSRVMLQNQPLTDMPQTTWQRVSVDYVNDIIGLWEGTACSGITYGDHNHRWLYLPSGQYYYYKQDSVGGQWTGKWVIGENNLNEYDLDGDFLACRWKENPTASEDRECWDVSVNDRDMYWSALRENAAGQRFNASFNMRRVSPTQKEASQWLLGKWIAYMIDGDSIPTDEKSVHTFLDNGFVQYTVPEADSTKDMTQWHNRLTLNYSLLGTYLVEQGLDNNKAMVQWRSSLAEMDNDNLLVFAFASTREDKPTLNPYNEIRLKKVMVDYQDQIVCRNDSIWKGIEGKGDFSPEPDHLWEYQEPDAKGTRHYVYYSKDPNTGKWVDTNEEHGKYLVDGNLLATSWKNNKKYEHECWDISIKNDTMIWTGLRETKTTYFKMVRVPKSEVGPFAN